MKTKNSQPVFPNKIVIAAAVLSAIPTVSSFADDLDHRHGAIELIDQERGWEIAGGATYTWQNVKDDVIQNTSFTSVDLLFSRKFKRGEISIYLEANTSPNPDGVASQLGDSNGDAGSALNENNIGRIQLSDFHYTRFNTNYEYALGLVDLTGFFDQSEYAADETSKFLASPLVHNPTIEFPDYTIAAVYDRHQRINIKATLASSHGIGDNPDRNYESLIDVAESGKGVFAAIENDIVVNRFNIKLGGWVNTSDHESHDGGTIDEINYGLYTSIDGKFGNIGTNIRVGWANPDVSETDTFFSVAAKLPLVVDSVGVGVAYMGLSDKVDSQDMNDSILAEAYFNYELTDNVLLTPSVQLIKNYGFDSTGDTYDKNLKLINMRVSVNF